MVQRRIDSAIGWFGAARTDTQLFGGFVYSRLTMRFAFVCRTCGCDLTDFLSEEDHVALNSSNIGGPMIQPGIFVRINSSKSKQEIFGITFADSQEGAVVVVKAGDFIMNVADLRHQMHSQASFGCCGYQGGPESNALCQNGHAVATIHSDCWHAAFARLIGDSVESVAA